MCSAFDDLTRHSPKATLSLSFESYENLPIAPLCERRVSDKIASALLSNDENMHALLCTPLTLEPSTHSSLTATKTKDPVQLSLKPSRGDERLVRRALHRLSSNASIMILQSAPPTATTAALQGPPSGAPKEEKQASAPVQTTSVLAERLSRLMAKQGEDVVTAPPTSDMRAKGTRRTESMKAEKRNTLSPVPLARGVRRARSGAALCA